MKEESKVLIQKMEQGFMEDVPNDSKRRIIENAFKVFIKRGFSGSRICDIAQQAGFSQGFVYNHFKSKDDIFTEITRLASIGSLRIIEAVNEMHITPFEKIFCLAEALTDWGTLAQMHFRFLLLHIVATDIIPEEATEIQKDAAKNQMDVLCGIIKEGQKVNEIKEGETITLALSFFAMVQGVAIMQSQAGRKLSFDIEELLGFFKKSKEVR